MPDTDMRNLNVLEFELAAIRKGDALHLAHAARALDLAHPELDEISNALAWPVSRRGAA